MDLTKAKTKEKKMIEIGKSYQRASEFLLNAPLDVPIEIEYLMVTAPCTQIASIVCILEDINALSIRVALLAVNWEGKGGFPEPNKDNYNSKPGRYKVNYLGILSWKVIEDEDLITYVGHNLIYSGLQQYITGVKAGKLPEPHLPCIKCKTQTPWRKLKGQRYLCSSCLEVARGKNLSQHPLNVV